MTWTELAARRNQRSRTYQDSENPRHKAWSGTLATLHYQSIADSNIYDAEVDMTPVRVDSPQFDGWRITQAGWHYALGKDLANHGDQDGWVGFGGRQGDHWFKFRLLRVGYLHWPGREWTDIGGAPNYNRVNLNQETGTLTIGPNSDEVKAGSTALWSNVWNTPGGGVLSLEWSTSGDRLKERVTINQSGREWIVANKPPVTPLNETYFGFVFQLDWSDIPKLMRGSELLDPDSDFDTVSENIELRDALSQLLGLMPLSHVTVIDESLNVIERHVLRKRFWKDGDGNHYLLLGVRCDVLNGMLAGDLVFDPTVDKVVVAGGDDGHCETIFNGFDSGSDAPRCGMKWDGNYCGFFRWIGVTISGTITVSYMDGYVHELGGAPELKVCGVDEDNPDAPLNCAQFEADPLTDAAIDWDTVDAVGTWERTPSLNAIFQELVGSYTVFNDAVMLQVLNDQAVDENYARFRAKEHEDGSSAAKLHIEYTTTVARIPRRPAAYSAPAIY